MIHDALEKQYDLNFLTLLKEIHSMQNISSLYKIRKLAEVLRISPDYLKVYENIFNYQLPLGEIAIGIASEYDTLKIGRYSMINENEHIYISNLLRAMNITYERLMPNKKKLIIDYRDSQLTPTCDVMYRELYKNEIQSLVKYPVSQLIIGDYIFQKDGKPKEDSNYENGVARTFVKCRECLLLRDYI